jgi:hypothetical protein
MSLSTAPKRLRPSPESGKSSSDTELLERSAFNMAAILRRLSLKRLFSRKRLMRQRTLSFEFAALNLSKISLRLA